MSHASPAGHVPVSLEMPLVVRGASRGFTVLLLGGAVQPWVAAASPAVGYWWLAVVAVSAFMFAARSALPPTAARGAWTNGPVAALASYLLVLPLVLSAAGAFPVQQMLFTAVTAVLVGSAVARVRLRANERSTV